MSEFSSEVELIAKPDPASIRSTRSEIESGLDDIEIPVSADVQGASSQVGAGRGSGGMRRRSNMSRQLASGRSEQGGPVIEHLEYGVELDETRNELLRELINETESGNFTRAKGGGLGMLGGALGLAGVGLAIGPAVASKVGESLSGIGGSIGEITGNVDISPSDVIGASAMVTAPAVIGSTATIVASDVIASKVGLSATDVIASAAAVSASDVVDTAATVGASTLIASAATVPASALVASAAAVLASDVVDSGAIIEAADVIGAKAEISVSDVINVPQDGLDLESVLLGGGAAAGAAGLASRFFSGPSGGGAPSTAGAGLGFPAPVAGAANLLQQLFPASEVSRGSGGPVGGMTPMALTPNPRLFTGGDSSRQRHQARERTNRRQSSGDINQTINVPVEGKSTRDIERIVERKMRELRRELGRELSSGAGGQI